MDISSTTYYGLAPYARRKLQLALTLPLGLPLLGLLGGVLTGNRLLLVAAALMSLFMAPLCIWLIRQLRRTRLGVGSSGLKVRGVLGNEEIGLAWDDIERMLLDLKHQGLVLREPLDHPVTQSMAKSSRVRFADASKVESIRGDLIAKQRWIPFESFSGWLEGGQLLEQFRQYAPHLANDYDLVATEFAKACKRRRVFLGCLCILFALIPVLLGVVLASLLSGSSGQASSWIDFLASLPSIALSIFILLLVPLLAYYAVLNLFAMVREYENRDMGAALTCLFLMALQTAFALWIATAVIYAKRG